MNGMKKIWIGVGVICALSLVSCGGGENKTAEAPKAPDSGAPAAGGAAATPDMDNGGSPDAPLVPDQP